MFYVIKIVGMHSLLITKTYKQVYLKGIRTINDPESLNVAIIVACSTVYIHTCTYTSVQTIQGNITYCIVLILNERIHVQSTEYIHVHAG